MPQRRRLQVLSAKSLHPEHAGMHCRGHCGFRSCCCHGCSCSSHRSVKCCQCVTRSHVSRHNVELHSPRRKEPRKCLCTRDPQGNFREAVHDCTCADRTGAAAQKGSQATDKRSESFSRIFILLAIRPQISYVNINLGVSVNTMAGHCAWRCTSHGLAFLPQRRVTPHVHMRAQGSSAASPASKSVAFQHGSRQHAVNTPAHWQPCRRQPQISRATADSPGQTASLPDPQPVTGGDGQPASLSNAPGIYAIYDAEGALQYVGMSRKV
jgi:hypothetical protein